MKILTLLAVIVLFPSSVFADSLKEVGSVGDELKIEVEFPKRCMFGDFDAIDFDMQYEADPSLRISLIPISSGSEVSREIMTNVFEKKSIKDANAASADHFNQMQTLKQQTLDSGLSVTFANYPKSSFAVVICKDSKRTQSCKGKTIKDIAKLMEAYKDPSKVKSVVPDNTYFYQAVVVKEGKLLALDKVISSNNRSLLSKEGVSKEVLSNMDIIQSLPLSSVDSSIKIQLPYFDKIKCGQ